MLPLLSVILDNTYSKADLYHRLHYFRQYLEYFFYSTEDTKLGPYDFLTRLTASERDTAAVSNWLVQTKGMISKDNLYDVLNEVYEAIKKLPVVTLYSPLEYKSVPKDDIGRWFRENSPDKILIEIRHDPEKLVGLALAKKGRYADFSLKYFLDKKSEDILKMIDSYAV